MGENRLGEDIKSLVEGYGYQLVEFHSTMVNKGLKSRVVLYKKGGLGLKDCETVHKAVMPRLEILYGEETDINLEVSSPGIDRVFKSPEEYSIFCGEPAAFLLKSNGQWVGGLIEETDPEKELIILRQKKDTLSLSFDEIQKGKLDYTRKTV